MENMAGQLVGWLLPGQPVGRLWAWTVVQFAGWLTGQLLAGEPVGLPAGCCDMPANQLRAWPFSKLFVFRGLAVLDDSFAKMAYAGVKQKSEIFRGLDWLASGWQLPGCPPGQRTGPPASWLLAG